MKAALSALFPVVLVHELGNILIMLLFGAHPTRLKATLSGFEIDYLGIISDKQEMITALAGPTLGLLFSLLCANFGQVWGSDYLLMCAGLGFVIYFFNFLPEKPLDGGRVLSFALCVLLGEYKSRPILRFVDLLTTILLLVSGLYFIAKDLGFALFFAGIWLMILQQNISCK